MRIIGSIAVIAVWGVAFCMPAASDAQGKKGGGSAIPLVSTHSDGDGVGYINPDSATPYANGDRGITIVVDGDYRMTMSCPAQDSCDRYLSVHLVPDADSHSPCPTVDLPAARVTLTVDALQTVTGENSRPARAQLRGLEGGEAVGPLYTLWWGSHTDSANVQVTNLGTNEWSVSTTGSALAMLQVPGPKGKAVLCGLVRASFKFTTAKQ